MTHRPIYLKDYQAPEFSISQTDLEFEIKADQVIVKNTMKFQVNGDSQPSCLRLNGRHAERPWIKLNGQPLTQADYEFHAEEIVLFPKTTKFELEITTFLKPQENTSLEGLYQSQDMLCTQCEPHGFRRITYYLDRPDVLSLFTTKIIADKTLYPVLLSNGNLIEHGDLGDQQHYAIWQDPYLKPCYLFALVAGNLQVREDDFTTRSGRAVKLQVFTRAFDFDKSAYALEALKESMVWDEKRFGLEYDLDVYMIVAVSDFNFGAMENKGLNIFNTKYALTSPSTATDHDYKQTQAVIAHEYFHNWTGNRVTCRDWFQLSLKEGLTVFRDQLFTQDHHSATVKRIEDVKLIQGAQFGEDCGPMAHPIRPASYVEMNNFYTTTVYNKGAEVIRMMQTLVGEKEFRAGMDLYFKRHDGKAVTCDDFVSAIADANPQLDFSQFKRWYSQAGTPLVEITDHHDASTETYRLNCQQRGYPTADGSTKDPWFIPLKVGFLDGQGQPIVALLKGDTEKRREWVLHFTESQQVFEFSGISEKPTPSLLRDFSAPVKLKFDHTPAQLELLFKQDHNSFNRWQAGQKLATQLIFERMEAIQSSKPVQPADRFIQGLAQALSQDTADLALISEMLTLPGDTILVQQLDLIPVEALHQARNSLALEIATQLAPQLHHTYQVLREKTRRYRRSRADNAARALKNICLHYLARLQDHASTQVLEAQFYEADNMTDQMAALSALILHNHTQATDQALAAFYAQWKQEALVMDKWLLLQASADVPNALERVQSLVEHPAFILSNPNKVYALILGFGHNHAHFHRADGKAYRWMAEMVKKLHINPQVAARCTRTLINFHRYDATRQAMMKSALQEILNSPGVSSDVSEIASKALHA